MSGFWQKALDDADSAQLLLEKGYYSGAVSRAYYAMFFAARSTLEAIDPTALGRLLNLAFDQRLIADYEPQPTQPDIAAELVTDMRRFLDALSPLNEDSP